MAFRSTRVTQVDVDTLLFQDSGVLQSVGDEAIGRRQSVPVVGARLMRLQWYLGGCAFGQKDPAANRLITLRSLMS